MCNSSVMKCVKRLSELLEIGNKLQPRVPFFHHLTTRLNGYSYRSFFNRIFIAKFDLVRGDHRSG